MRKNMLNGDVAQSGSTAVRRHYLHIVTGIERLQIKFSVWLCSPKAQVDGVVGVEAWDGVVISDSCHLCIYRAVAR